MSYHILKCSECNSYGLDEECFCGGKRVNSKPPKFSIEDKYAKYRRIAKETILNSKGISPILSILIIALFILILAGVILINFVF